MQTRGIRLPTEGEFGGKNCLVQIYPAAGAGGMLELPARRFVIGRDADCDLYLRDSDVSRNHATIEFKAGRFILKDLDSTNGTFVNDQQINVHKLVAGDYVRIGTHVVKFLSSDHIEAQYHEAIYNLMVTDGLTGVYNKRHFFSALEKELARARRHNRPMALVLLDIDHFKTVNDTYGHLAGDNVLRDFAQRLANLVREDELLARFGGEEFMVVLGEAGRDEAHTFAERLRKCVADQPFFVGENEVELTISLGVACTQGGEQITAEHIINQADGKLYEAKNAGRNRVVS